MFPIFNVKWSLCSGKPFFIPHGVNISKFSLLGFENNEFKCLPTFYVFNFNYFRMVYQVFLRGHLEGIFLIPTSFVGPLIIYFQVALFYFLLGGGIICAI